ncbi:hypothetical protein DTO212C5_1880 [Paecilomyces variotii]|nr:hypothetical protein DTO212C5_1880 [Paecilomyces variotii]
MFQKLRYLLNRPSESFQILSDLHLEIGRQYSSYGIPINAKYLILAGDIGRLADYNDYLDFLQKQTSRFELVFLVLGNHEFYAESFTTGLEKAQHLQQEPSLNGRLVLLHRKRYDVPGSYITILGCTLWSKVPIEAREVVQAKIKDFQKIDGWTVDDHNATHDSELAWLLREIQSIHEENERARAKTPRRTILVVTHHAPSLRGTSSPENAQNAWRFAFGTDVLSEMVNEVKVWVFGHTHYSTDFKEGGIRIVSNQRGYALPWKSTEDRFDVGKVIRVS